MPLTKLPPSRKIVQITLAIRADHIVEAVYTDNRKLEATIAKILNLGDVMLDIHVIEGAH